MIYELHRMRVTRGEETTAYLARQPMSTLRVGVAGCAQADRLDRWFPAEKRPEAIVTALHRVRS